MAHHLNKALPPIEELDLQRVAERRWNALGGDLLFPALVLKESALHHNIDVMADFCRRHGVSLAPHGKTTMSPQLIRRQLAAGAWGITAATPSQARAMREFGAERVVIANQVPDRLGLSWMASEMAGNPEVEVYSLVDSVRIVELMDGALAGAALGVQIPVLIELGVEGGRTGCRTLDAAREVAAAVRGSRWLRLAGVEAFEGVIGHDPAPSTLARVDGLLGGIRALVEELAHQGAFAGAPEIVVSAGGSSYFDRVVAVLGGDWPVRRPVRLVLRSGCYVTHDHGMYLEGSPFGTRISESPALKPAMELWGLVHSRPEPSLAIVGFGKRDCSYDAGLPVPLQVRSGSTTRPAPDGMEVTRLNDQHAFCRLAADADLQVGDAVGFGLSHPCTVFDKWRVIPVVDDDYRVLEIIETFF
jgi:D-serine deaminase-like pyridoxal phosphate-dependent protein